jgi:DNA-binding SARP family transcriptional activator
MEFGLLGPLEASDDGDVLPLGGPKQRTLLAHLVLHVNGVVTTERLIDSIWGDEPPETARNTLQTYIRHLRRIVGADRIHHRSAGYVLEARPDEVDLLRFVALVEEAKRLSSSDLPGAGSTLRDALGLWRGPALDDLAEQPSLHADIARLEELRMAVTEDRIDADLRLGAHRELVPELEVLVGEHPFRERLWGQLMVALYRSGRQGDALEAFQRARGILAEELGIDPSPDLQRLQDQILQQDAALAVAGEPLRGYRLLTRSRTIRSSSAGSKPRRRRSRASNTPTSFPCTTSGASPTARTW